MPSAAQVAQPSRRLAGAGTHEGLRACFPGSRCTVAEVRNKYRPVTTVPDARVTYFVGWGAAQAGHHWAVSCCWRVVLALACLAST
jgi:hypothetical protein